MKIQDTPQQHLTYCLNIHAGETWAENRKAIEEKATAVRDRVAEGQPFGLGLRLGSQAAAALKAPPERAALKAYLDEQNMYAFTINGFPYGQFHAGAVKEKVYQPDWRTVARREYTILLADILADLLPEGMSGSISTVPASWKPWIIRPDDSDRIVRELSDCVRHLAAIKARTGRVIHLGLEPEPGCLLETTAECVAFFNDVVIPRGTAYLKRRGVRNPAEAEAMLRCHLGVCLDTCHVAIQFEDLVEALDTYVQEGIRISKVQLSAALEVFNERSRIEALHPFVEPVYLHQVKAETRHGAVRSWNDLPDALRVVKDQAEYERLRVHYHVPLFWSGSSLLDSTVHGLTDAFFSRLREGSCEHLEIETYTFDVLPEELKEEDVVESIVKEYQWVLGRLASSA